MDPTTIIVGLCFLAGLAFVVTVASWKGSGDREKRKHAEDEQEEVEQILEDREEYDRAFQEARGRGLAGVREYLRRMRDKKGR